MHTVEGLISEQDKQDLARLAGASDRKGIVCEIGSLYGASAIAILQGLAGNGDFIFCYDLFEPEKLETFRRNLAGIGFSDKYLAIPGDFNLTFPHPSANRAIAFAFVDHDFGHFRRRKRIDHKRRRIIGPFNNVDLFAL